jgi:hypothetical protein
MQFKLKSQMVISLITYKQKEPIFLKQVVDLQALLLQHNGGRSYQRICNQSHTPRFHELIKCEKISGILSMVIITKYVITIKALVTTLLLGTSVIAHTICQDSLMKIGIM